MKVIKLKINAPLQAGEKLLKAMLLKDFDAFKATSKQFLRNNQAYYPSFSGMIA